MIYQDYYNSRVAVVTGISYIRKMLTFGKFIKGLYKVMSYVFHINPNNFNSINRLQMFITIKKFLNIKKKYSYMYY